MNRLTAEMQRIVDEQRLGFVATVCTDGTPNLSPKGTFVVLDDEHLLFAEIRSPNTAANLAERPAMEVNFVDPLARKGFRAKGRASYQARGTAGFDRLLPLFERWGELTGRIRGIVTLRVERALPLTSPAYDLGADEGELCATWMAHFAALLAAREASSKGPGEGP